MENNSPSYSQNPPTGSHPEQNESNPNPSTSFLLQVKCSTQLSRAHEIVCFWLLRIFTAWCQICITFLNSTLCWSSVVLVARQFVLMLLDSQPAIGWPRSATYFNEYLSTDVCFLVSLGMRGPILQLDRQMSSLASMMKFSQLTQWSRVLLEKLPVSKLLKELSTFYGTPRSITMLERIHWYIFWATWILSTNLPIYF
jgi:hypothetical protein